MLKLIEKWEGHRIYKYQDRTFHLSWYGRGKGKGWRCTEEVSAGKEIHHYEIKLLGNANLQEAVIYLKYELGINQ